MDIRNFIVADFLNEDGKFEKIYIDIEFIKMVRRQKAGCVILIEGTEYTLKQSANTIIQSIPAEFMNVEDLSV
jgi:hypothetical protein